MTDQQKKTKSSDLWVRFTSAVVFTLVMIVGLLLHEFSYGILMSAIMVVGLNEYYNLIANKREKNRVSKWYKPLAIGSAVIFYLLVLAVVVGLIDGPYATVVFVLPVFTLFFFVLEMFADSVNPIENIGLNILGLIYVVTPVVMSIGVVYDSVGKDVAFNGLPLLAAFALIWLNDVWAYLVGRTIGRNKFFPRLSPGKTWEGIVGGLAGSVASAAFFYYVFQQFDITIFPLTDFIIIAVICSVFGDIGDLVESMFKRSLNVKDTGTLMPGHGGVLDRFDSFFFAIPMVFFYLFITRLADADFMF